VTEGELRSRLLGDVLPGEIEAGERTWNVVRAAYATRERVPWIERHSRAVLVVAAAAALAVAAVSPPGRALVEEVRDQVAGQSPAEPALVRLPSPGRLLVVSDEGIWVAHEDGSKRLLGDYEQASWSPRGLFVVAAQGNHLVTIEAETGKVRWSLSRTEPVRDPRWSGGGLDTRIAYRAGRSLHVVAGDGSPDVMLAGVVAPVAPAWKADTHVLAYATPDGRVHVIDVDARRELWSTAAGPAVTQLEWSSEGRRLLALSLGQRPRIYDGRGRPAGALELAAGHVAVRAAFAPSGDALAYTQRDLSSGRSSLVLVEGGSSHTPFPAAGRLQDVAWSPDGRWVLVTWPSADQWLFLRGPGMRRIVAVPGIDREFDPGGTGRGAVPRVAGWIGE
jgi:hypothetical protein